LRQDSHHKGVLDLVYYGIKGGISMKKFIMVGLVIVFTLAAVGFKFQPLMDIIVYA